MGNLSALLPYVQIVLCVLLVAGILFQRSEAGLGEAFGTGDGGSFGHTRRGLEKTIFNATVVIAVLFTLSTFLALIV